MRTKRNGNRGPQVAQTLYAAIGGEAAVRAAIDGMYARILGDVVMGPFFAGIDMEHLKRQQVAFFSQLLGGPQRYKGPGMQELHDGIRIEQRHFDRVVQHLVASLTALHLEAGIIDEILSALKPLAADIVNTNSAEDSLAADNREALVFRQMMENSPINVIRADTDFIIRYMNDSSRKTLAKLAHLLPCKVEEIVGRSVDIFHKDPAHQRRILSDPKNLPHRANIQLGPEVLDLLVSPVFDAQNKYMGAMVTWDVVTEKLRLEAANKDYSAQVAALQEFQAIIEFNMDGTILGANQNFLKIFGYSPEEVKGRHHSVLVAESERNLPAYKELWAKLNRGEYVQGESKRIAKDGREVWIQAWYNAIPGVDGKLAKIVAYVNDVTEKNLSAADAKGQIAAISRSQAIVEFSMDGTVLGANENFLQTMGYRLDEIKGKHHSMFVEDAFAKSPDYREFWAKLNHGEHITGELKRLGKGGKEIWLQASYNCIFDLNGRPFKVVKYAVDITEQKLAAADAGGQVAAINKAQLVVECTMDGQILRANNHFLDLFGYTLGEIQGKPIGIFATDADRDSEKTRDLWAKLHRGEGQQGEYQRKGKGGKELWLQISYNPILDLNGKPFKVVEYCIDTTEQVKAKEEIARMAERDRRAAQELKEKVDSILKVVAAAAKGDLTQTIAVQGSDAIGQMGEGLSQFFNDLRQSISGIGETALSLTSASEELTTVSQQMSANAQETAAQANTVATATQQVSQNLHSVATGAEEMSSTVQSIAGNATEAAKIAGEAVQAAQSANTTVQKLGTSSAEIGQVIKVITSIAQQTNLLALNATIEAARAGEAGKGFAVVANEVKELAKQTAKATEDISHKINAIQQDTQKAVESIASITEVIGKINDISGTIATAVEEQSATTNEMSRNVTEAAKGSGDISQNIQGVAEAAESTTRGAEDTQKSAQSLAEMAGHLRTLVDRFKVSTEQGSPSNPRSTDKARGAHASA
jgi:methyl-accepting chemotaxis protein